jgi:LacI family transcriptional regulator, gluconate utilization system Gnt-I transcriptional repressor
LPRSVIKPNTGPITSPITMADVAARLGVSKMTVSRALQRGTGPVERAGSAVAGNSGKRRADSLALHRQILKTCRDMGYVVDHTARTLSNQRSGFVAALIPALNNSNFSDTAHGLSRAVEAAGLQLLLGYTDYNLLTEERLLRAMLARRPEGVVLTGGSHTAATRKLLKAAGVPVVETWDWLAKPFEHAVGFSNAQASAELVRALHAKGYRQFAFLSGAPESDARGAERRAGFQLALQGLGLDASRCLGVGLAPVSMAQGALGVAQALQRWPEVQVLVCVSDHAAFGALAECQRRGWAVPQRLAIAGFGGFEVGTACHPQLSTVVVDGAGIGQAAGDLLARAISAARRGQRLAPERLQAPFQVELRGSS